MTNIIIQYECDITGDHTCSIASLCDIREKVFIDEYDAIHFLAECTSVVNNNIKQWETKKKRAENALKKLYKKQKYYLKKVS